MERRQCLFGDGFAERKIVPCGISRPARPQATHWAMHWAMGKGNALDNGPGDTPGNTTVNTEGNTEGNRMGNIVSPWLILPCIIN